MTPADLRDAVERGNARRATDVLDALVADDTLDDDAWLGVLTLVEEALGQHAFRHARAPLGLALRMWMVRRERDPAFFRSPLGEIARDVWRGSDDFSMQYLCDFAGAALRHDPDDDTALDAFLEGTFIEGGPVEPYLHRGVDLELVADSMPDRPRKAMLLALHGLIRRCAGWAHAEKPIERAKAIDPALDVDALLTRLERFAPGIRD